MEVKVAVLCSSRPVRTAIEAAIMATKRRTEEAIIIIHPSPGDLVLNHNDIDLLVVHDGDAWINAPLLSSLSASDINIIIVDGRSAGEIKKSVIGVILDKRMAS